MSANILEIKKKTVVEFFFYYFKASFLNLQVKCLVPSVQEKDQTFM